MILPSSQVVYRARYRMQLGDLVLLLEAHLEIINTSFRFAQTQADL